MRDTHAFRALDDTAWRAVLDFIVDNYQPIVSDLEDELDALEQDVFAETYKRGTIQRLYELRKELTRMRLAVARRCRSGSGVALTPAIR